MHADIIILVVIIIHSVEIALMLESLSDIIILVIKVVCELVLGSDFRNFDWFRCNIISLIEISLGTLLALIFNGLSMRIRVLAQSLPRRIRGSILGLRVSDHF